MTSLTPFMVLNIFGCLFAGLLVTLALIRCKLMMIKMLTLTTPSFIRIYMFDRVQEKGLAYRREDLRFLPTLNCTRFTIILPTLDCSNFILDIYEDI